MFKKSNNTSTSVQIANLRRLNPDVLATGADVRNALTALVEKLGSQRAAAREIGMSTGYIGDALHGRREVGPELAFRLGYERTVVFIRR